MSRRAQEAPRFTRLQEVFLASSVIGLGVLALSLGRLKDTEPSTQDIVACANGKIAEAVKLHVDVSNKPVGDIAVYASGCDMTELGPRRVKSFYVDLVPQLDLSGEGGQEAATATTVIDN